MKSCKLILTHFHLSDRLEILHTYVVPMTVHYFHVSNLITESGKQVTGYPLAKVFKGNAADKPCLDVFKYLRPTLLFLVIQGNSFKSVI